MILEMYRILLSNVNLNNITYFEDIILCGGVCISILLDTFVIFIIMTLLIKKITGRCVMYWINKIIKI